MSGRGKKIFVSGPYNHPDKKVMEQRVDIIAKYCVTLFNQGHFPISALLMGLSFAAHGKLPTDTETWTNFSEALIPGNDEIHILHIDGWLQSSGVQIETDEATRLKIEIVHVPREVINKFQ